MANVADVWRSDFEIRGALDLSHGDGNPGARVMR